MQLALGIMWCVRQIRDHDNSDHQLDVNSIDQKAIAAAVLCFVAEFFCNHAMITGNHFLNVIEASLWTIALGILIPDTIKMIIRAKKIFDNHPDIDGSQLILFLWFVLATCICFVG